MTNPIISRKYLYKKSEEEQVGEKFTKKKNFTGKYSSSYLQ